MATPCISHQNYFTLDKQGKLQRVTLYELILDNGEILPRYDLVFQFWGTPKETADNIILVEHALTGNSHLTSYSTPYISNPGWWEQIVGPGKPLDTNQYCVICVNALGGCDGSTGPSSLHPDGTAWGSQFPVISLRDQVRAEYELMQGLGINSFYSIIGGSMGGARVLEWMLSYPEYVQRALVLAISAQASALMIATQNLQIEAITSDPYWNNGDYYQTCQRPDNGLRLARQIAHLSYRTAEELNTRFGNTLQNSYSSAHSFTPHEQFAVTSYLHYQADKLLSRFDAGSYVTLTHALNTHDVGRGRGGVKQALQQCKIPCIIAGIVEDRLFPISEQQFIYEHLAGSQGFYEIHSLKGHDGFLTEVTEISTLIKHTLCLPANPLSATKLE